MGRIKVCNFGRIMLKIFCWTTVILAIYLILGITGCYEKWFGGPAGIVKAPVYWLIRAGIGILVESIIFWIGIIMVYATSEQLGIRWRVLGIVCGWIPVAHLVMRFDLSRCFSAKHYISENSVQNIRRADNPQRLRIIGSKVLFYL